MEHRTWKTVERRVARTLGGHRVGCSGRDTPDVVSDWLSVEVKHRRRLPQWLKDALAQALRHAGADRLGIAVLHEKGRHDSIVVLSFSDFCEWFVEVKNGGHSQQTVGEGPSDVARPGRE